MKLIVGLGNPDLKYKKTRHNVGFMVLDYIKNHFSNQGFSFENFIFDKNSKAEISKGIFNSKKILLVKPQTYMNNSGFSVERLTNYYKLNPENDLIIIYDDIDLSLGSIRMRGKSSGGHKGMQSIIDNLKTDNIPRIRIGIRSEERNEIQDIAFHVLQNFKKSEKKKLDASFKEIISFVKNFLSK